MSILPIASGPAAIMTDSGRLKLEFCTYEVFSAKLPAAFDGVRVLHLSDLHAKKFGRRNMGLAAACASLRPDIICFTGDSFSRNEEFSAVMDKLDFMGSLAETAPTFYVRGNHENDRPKIAEPFETELRKLRIHVLRNQQEDFFRGGSAIKVTGLELPRECYRLPNGSYFGLKKVTPPLLNELAGRADRSVFNLLLAHTPLPFHAYAAWGADLTLSGHVHGGISRIGEVGIFSPERKFFPKYTKHLYRIRTPQGFSSMEVSAGLGKFRINNPPTLSICILRRTEK